jgi:hypothetical protein
MPCSPDAATIIASTHDQPCRRLARLLEFRGLLSGSGKQHMEITIADMSNSVAGMEAPRKSSTSAPECARQAG